MSSSMLEARHGSEPEYLDPPAVRRRDRTPRLGRAVSSSQIGSGNALRNLRRRILIGLSLSRWHTSEVTGLLVLIYKLSVVARLIPSPPCSRRVGLSAGEACDISAPLSEM